MEYFGIKYVVKSNKIEVNILVILVILFILWNNFDLRLVLLWGMMVFEFIEIFV